MLLQLQDIFCTPCDNNRCNDNKYISLVLSSGDNIPPQELHFKDLRLLGYVAEQERAFIKQRQAEGIACAKAKGKKLGRPAIEYPSNWEETYNAWKDKQITARKAMKRLGIKPTSFYKLVKLYEKEKE